MNKILAPISTGELLDKISILQIKIDHTTDASKLANIKRELAELDALSPMMTAELSNLYQELKSVNQIIWDIEDNIRDLEKKQLFDHEFVQTARSVYINNDLRAQIKKKINLLTESYIVEEKCYDQ